MASIPIASWQIDGKKNGNWQTLFSWAAKWVWVVTAAMNSKTLAPWKESYDKPRQSIKKHRYHFADKGPYFQSYGFSNSHVQMWELDYKEGWVPKK